MPIVTQENILKLLYSYNPWWRDGVLPKEYSRPTKRFAFNEASKVLLHPDLNRFVVLSGARRVGKTTLLYQLIEKLLSQGTAPQNILYVSFDHPLLKFCSLEKVFLFLCFNSSSIISISAISKELDGTPAATVSNYIQFLERANLIYISNPVNIDGKKILKIRPKIYIADAAIRNAVLMLDNVLADPEEMGIMVETSVYKHLAAFYYREHTTVGYFRKSGSDKEIDIVVEFPAGKILAEVKYRENSEIKSSDAIVEMACSDTGGIVSALVITKRPDDYGLTSHSTKVPIMRVPAHAFLYLLGMLKKQATKSSSGLLSDIACIRQVR